MCLSDHAGLEVVVLTVFSCSITIAVGLLVCVVLPDFPDTWKRLTPELKHVANRRMAIDGAEADVDVGGAMTHLKGAKLAFTDPKVRPISKLSPFYDANLSFRRICSLQCTIWPVDA